MRHLGLLRLAARGAFLVVLTVIVYATVVPISMRPSSGHLHPERMLAYCALGGTMAVGFPRRMLWVVLAVVAIACGLEFLQLFIPTRDGRLPDAIEKSVGGLAGVAMGWALSKTADRLTPRFGRSS